jgi:hypothetical protein
MKPATGAALAVALVSVIPMWLLLLPARIDTRSLAFRLLLVYAAVCIIVLLRIKLAMHRRKK